MYEHGYFFLQNTRAIINLQLLRTRTYAHAHIHSRPQATPPIDIEGCGLRDQRCCNVHPASFNQLAKETRYSRGSFARNSSRQKTSTTESPPSVKQSRTTSNPERCSFVAFEPPKVCLSSLPVDPVAYPGGVLRVLEHPPQPTCANN